ncbi:HAD family hydrolase [Sinobaca sp. H24]|uniref:HAD family hydrolase n=1 Tax=Sinobaca sp. H24 TaxID=2923376 RepID=UPI00207AAD62|nr:HAD-IA family hydrolase [Sinobaca sp. H24]
MRWESIFFDLDNTLYSHELAFEKSIIHTFQKRYRPDETMKHIDEKTWFATFKYYCDKLWTEMEEDILTYEEYRVERFAQTMKYFDIEMNEKEAMLFHDQYEREVAKFVEPYKGMKELFENLSKANIYIGIITNGKKETQLDKWKALHVEKYIPKERVYISEELGIKKPNSKIFTQVLKQINSRPSKSLYVGDSWSLDVQASMEAGMECIFLNTREEPRQNGQPPFAECENFEEAARLIVSRINPGG